MSKDHCNNQLTQPTPCVTSILSNASFWEQTKVQKAIQYIDAWATLKWHRIHGGTGVPAEKIEGCSSSSRRGSPSNMPAIFDASITVERTLKSLGDPWILKSLLLWLYPKSGTYQRSADAQTFRPHTLQLRAKEFGWSDTRLTDLLKFEERRFLHLLAKKI